MDVECITEENSLLIENSSIGGSSSSSSSSSSSRSSSSSGISSGGSERGGLEGKGDSNTIDEVHLGGVRERALRDRGPTRAHWRSSQTVFCRWKEHRRERIVQSVRVRRRRPPGFTHKLVRHKGHPLCPRGRHRRPQLVATSPRENALRLPPRLCDDRNTTPPSNASSSSRQQQQQQQQQKVSLFCRSAYEKATTTTTTPSPSTTTASSSPSSSSPPLLQITFVSPEKAVSIGQAVVMYHHSTSRVLGVGSVAYHGRTVFEEEKEEEQRRKQRQSEKKNDDKE